MNSNINVLEPVSKAYVFGCTRRLEQHFKTYSVMQKCMVTCATKRLACSRIEERSGHAPHQATSATRITLDFPDMLEPSQSHQLGILAQLRILRCHLNILSNTGGYSYLLNHQKLRSFLIKTNTLFGAFSEPYVAG